VAPEAARTGGGLLARDLSPNEVVIVIDFEGTETILTNVNCFGRVEAAALPTLQTTDACHDILRQKKLSPWTGTRGFFSWYHPHLPPSRDGGLGGYGAHLNANPIPQRR